MAFAGYMRRHHALPTLDNHKDRHSHCPFGKHYFVSKTGGYLYHHGDPRVIQKMLELTNLKEGACSLDTLAQVMWEHSIFYYETAVHEVAELHQSTLQPCMFWHALSNAGFHICIGCSPASWPGAHLLLMSRASSNHTRVLCTTTKSTGAAVSRQLAKNNHCLL